MMNLGVLEIYPFLLVRTKVLVMFLKTILTAFKFSLLATTTANHFLSAMISLIYLLLDGLSQSDLLTFLKERVLKPTSLLITKEISRNSLLLKIV